MINRSIRAVALSAAAAGVTSADLENLSGRGAHVVIDVTAISGTSPTLTVTVDGYDETSGKYYTLLQSASLSATGTTVLRIYPGVTAAANAAASDVIPRVFRVATTIGGTTPSVTATVGVNLIG